MVTVNESRNVPDARVSLLANPRLNSSLGWKSEPSTNKERTSESKGCPLPVFMTERVPWAQRRFAERKSETAAPPSRVQSEAF
jgi:hypothetical protein